MTKGEDLFLSQYFYGRLIYKLFHEMLHSFLVNNFKLSCKQISNCYADIEKLFSKSHYGMKMARRKPWVPGILPIHP